MTTVDFANPKTAGATKKKNQCSKGSSCGYSCIPKGAKCSNPLAGQAKDYADWMAGQAGGAIVKRAETGDHSDGKAKPRSNIDAIDQKYASAKPSDSDADNWLKERLHEHTSPEGLALLEMMTKHHTVSAWQDVSHRVKGIKDKESFIRATIEEERAVGRYSNRGNNSWESYSRFTRTNRRKMQADLENPETSDEGKAKLKQKLDKDRQTSERVAAEVQASFDKIPEDRYKKLEAGFDEAIAKRKTESQELQAKIAKGDVRTIQNQTEQMLRPFSGYRDGSADATPLATRKRHQELAKRYLIQTYTQPERVLDIKPDATPNEIKAAYRKAAFKAHPDQGGSDEAFRRVNDAYNKLKMDADFSEFLELADAQWDVCVELGALEFVEASQQFTEQFLSNTMTTVDFARLRMAGNTKQKKQCKKGYSCGFSCIQRGAQCRNPLDGQAKDYAGWMSKQAGGAIVLSKKGGIASTKKAETSDTPASGNAKPRYKIDEIDQKYASAKPSDKDGDNWLKERLNHQASPEGLALLEMMEKRLGVVPGEGDWDSASERVKRVKDKESFVRATIEERRAAGERAKARSDYDKWEPYSIYGAKGRQTMEKKLANPKTSDAEKAKLRKKLDSDRQSAEKTVAAVKARYNKSPEEARKELEAEFDAAIVKNKTKSQELQAKIAKGDAQTIQAETERMLKPFEVYKRGTEGDTPLATRKRHQEMAKQHLIAQASRVPPEQVLGIRADASTAEIKAAYRKAAFKAHPDQGGSAEAFQKVNDAYNKLKQDADFSEFLELSEVQWDVCVALGALEFVEASEQFTEQFLSLEFSDRASKEIEIIRAGTHTSSNGITVSFDRSDLEEIAATYDPSHFQAPLIISHDTKGVNDRLLAHSEFAYGAPKKLKVVGDRLRAVFDKNKIAPEFVQWVRDGKLLSVSASVYLRESPTNPTPGKLSLRHIAGLGKSPPAIKGMTPLSLSELVFGEPEEGLVTVSESIASNDEGILLAELDDEREQRMDELEQREKDIKKREGELALREAELRKTEFSSFCEGLKGQLIPAIAPNADVVTFMEFLAFGSAGELSFSEEKNHTPLDWFKGFLKRLPKQVEFGERVKGNVPQAATSQTREGVDPESIEVDRQAQVYMQQHSVNYSEALTALGHTF